jgi:putative endopeptidase
MGALRWILSKPGRRSHLADAAAPYLSKRFVAASFAFHGRIMNGVAQQPERWRRAVDAVNDAMGQAGRIYVMLHFSPEGKTQIRIDWMSRPTKLRALDKLARLRVKIAYPDKWLDYSPLELRSDAIPAKKESIECMESHHYLYVFQQAAGMMNAGIGPVRGISALATNVVKP